MTPLNVIYNTFQMTVSLLLTILNYHKDIAVFTIFNGWSRPLHIYVGWCPIIVERNSSIQYLILHTTITHFVIISSSVWLLNYLSSLLPAITIAIRHLIHQLIPSFNNYFGQCPSIVERNSSIQYLVLVTSTTHRLSYHHPFSCYIISLHCSHQLQAPSVI